MKLRVLFVACCLCYTSALPTGGASADEPGCKTTLDYRPVCGNNDKTYPNLSALECEKAKTPNLEKKTDGRCPGDGHQEVLAITVPPVCKTITRNMQPVCGTDGVSYDNESLLKCAAAEQIKDIKVAREGRCDEGKVDTEFDEDECECTRQMIPVCGKNGVTYSNKCILKCAGVEIAKQGKC